MKDKTESALHEAECFIIRHFISEAPSRDPDNYLQQCFFCAKKAWLIHDIKHSKSCEAGRVFKKIKDAYENLRHSH
jgi:hypothetical protein